MNSDKAYLEYIIKGLVSYPDRVNILRSIDNMGVLLSVYIAPEDMGRIIGKKGETSKAIRTLLNCYGYSQQAKVSVKIMEPLQNNQ